jgi:hypothetical protein
LCFAILSGGIQHFLHRDETATQPKTFMPYFGVIAFLLTAAAMAIDISLWVCMVVSIKNLHIQGISAQLGNGFWVILASFVAVSIAALPWQLFMWLAVGIGFMAFALFAMLLASGERQRQEDIEARRY